jgi:hypothetical protein
MSTLYQQFRTDPDIEIKGIILQYGKNSKDVPIEIRIARAGGGNQRYLKALEKRTKPFRRQIQSDTLDRDIQREVLIEVYADTVVLGWSGVEDEKGAPLPFTRENVIKLFNDLPDLFNDVMDMSVKATLFRSEMQESQSGN